MADTQFEDPRLAALYDPLDPDRSDLDVYAAIADELGARSILDVGCGTGTLACILASRGMQVTGVDPAAASLDIARSKLHASLVNWVHGDVRAVGALGVDLVTMTGNVAQVFTNDDEWLWNLRWIHGFLDPAGHLVFETRDPQRKAWLQWTKDSSYDCSRIDGTGTVESWVELVEVDARLVTFRSVFVFDGDERLESISTLCFRNSDEIAYSLDRAGFQVDEIRDAPDRPARELVFFASRNDATGTG
jgi:SAM-dependent methyltransferase